MPVRFARAYALTTLGLAGLLAAGPAFADCTAPQAEFARVVQSSDLEAIARTGRAVLNEASCPDALRAVVGRRAALAHVRASNVAGERGVSIEERLRILTAGAAFGGPWQLHAAVGDLRRVRREFGPASLAYQTALEDIDDAAANPSPPPREIILRIMRLAQEARLAAPDFVPTRSLTRSIRSITVAAAPIPVQFVRDQDRMTELGERYAEETFQILVQEGRPRIRLVGHTDPDGSIEYNRDLSLRRAGSFRDFLIRRGYSGDAIRIDGRGKEEPFEPMPGVQYSQAELYQMLRRVELVRE